ncbi:hypothetical protein KM043_018161 [Ampulex compressa]|nr:hypothetical protein KM043_018161 [Ampulex compressa]
MFHSIDGKRFSFGSSSRGSSKSYSSASRSSGHKYGSHSSSHSSSHTSGSTSGHGNQGSHGSNSNGQRSSLGSHTSNQNSHLGGQASPTSTHTETNKYQGSSNGHGTSSGTTSHQTNKDASTRFLESEGGGAARPSQGKSGPDFSRNTNPSAPPYNQGHMPNTQVQPNSGSHLPGGTQPSAPPYDHIHTTNFGGINTNAQPKSSPYLPGNTQPSAPPHNSMPSPGGFNPHGMNTGGHPGNLNPTNSPIGLESFQKSNSNSLQKQGPNSSPIGFENFQKNHNPYPSEFGGHYGATSPYAPTGQMQTPVMGHAIAQPAMQPYIPGQTVIMLPNQQDSGRGMGQLIKEALVFSAVHTGVQALFNPHTHSSSGVRPSSDAGTTTTHITHNNYYNAPPGSVGTSTNANEPQGNIPLGSFGTPTNMNVPQGYVPAGTPTNYPIGGAFPTVPASTSDSATTNNNGQIARLITNHTSVNVTDEAKEPLLYVQPELNDYPTILSTRALFDNYVHNAGEKEYRTGEKRKEENLLVDLFLNTNVMINAMQWLANNGFIDPDDFERKDVLRHIWFTQYGGTTCGFERVFMSEKYGDFIIGIQDWIYFDYLESQKRIDYMGYVDKLKLGNKAALLKINYQMEGIIKPNATIFAGTLPELEMALYTICFYARPNDLCPISLGGAKFYILTHSFRYYGHDLIDLGIPVF